MNTQAYLDFAVGVAKNAGITLRQGYLEERDINSKSSQVDLVTQYDLAVEAMITTAIAGTYPAHRLLGEEGAARGGDSPFLWVVDPLDGTTNFAHRYPTFCVSIALYQHNQPLVGVVYDPLRDDLFYASAGCGAVWEHTLNGKSIARSLQVSQTDTLLQSLLGTGFPYDRHTSDLDNIAQFKAFSKQVQGIRRSGSAALELAYLAAGRLDGFWEFKLSAWDVAAGVLLITEAGGMVTNMEGGEIVLPNAGTQNVHLIASNKHIHKAMLNVIRQTS
jgi:myo-inositol-1(or 4)-monophosphatase